MIRAVFVDIDGTLVNDKKEISQRTKQAIQKAKEKGIEVVICTGRSRISAQTFQKDCQMSRYLISTNGSEIYDCQAGEVLFHSDLEVETCEKLYEMAIENDMIIKLNFGYGRAINKVKYKEDYEIELQEDITHFLNHHEITQISLCCEKKEKIEQVKKYMDRLPYTIIVNEFIWEKCGKIFHCVHCANSNVSKGNAMAGLCKFLRIDLKDVVAIRR